MKTKNLPNIYRLKLFLLFSYSVLSTIFGFSENIYYVNQSFKGYPRNGLSLETPFTTIEKALEIIGPGETIYIVGEYKNPSYNPEFSYVNSYDPHLWHSENSIKINNIHGKPDSYITIAPFNSNTVLKGDGGNIFRVQNASYLIIKNFRIEGEVKRIPLSTANKLQFVYIDIDRVKNPLSPLEDELTFRDRDIIGKNDKGDLIYKDISFLNIKRPSYIDTRGLYLSNVHHIDIIGNTISYMPGGGLRVSDCEDINIIDNEIFQCSRRSYTGTHALVVTKTTSTRESNDYRVIIKGNRVHHNYNEQYSWSPEKNIITPHIDEGKGISLQRNQTVFAKDGSIKLNYEHGRILVDSNICYFNGFSGIHSNDGNRIDFINNISFFNSYTNSITNSGLPPNGTNIGISAQGGSDIRIIGNISVIDLNLKKYGISSDLTPNDGLIVEDNIIYGINLNGESGSIDEDFDIVQVQKNTRVENPNFVDPLNFDFNR